MLLSLLTSEIFFVNLQKGLSDIKDKSNQQKSDLLIVFLNHRIKY